MLNLVTALHCEARPLYRHFKLQRRADCHVYPVYQSTELRLIVTGVGKLASAAATAYCAALEGSNGLAAFLNIGTAGHQHFHIGEPLLIHEVIDEGSQRHWYPQTAFHTTLSSDLLTTFDAPNLDYSRPGAYDMELAGIMASAVRWTTLELTQAMKVISDNGNDPADRSSKARVEKLIAAQLEAVEGLVTAMQAELHELRDLAVDDQLPDAIAGLHFTHYQRQHLARLLGRLRALDVDPANVIRASSGDAASILKQLGAYLENTQLALTSHQS